MIKMKYGIRTKYDINKFVHLWRFFLTKKLKIQ